jgi:hypothetical protein
VTDPKVSQKKNRQDQKSAMKRHQAKLAINLAVFIAATAILSLAAIPARAQQGGVPPVLESRDADMARQAPLRSLEKRIENRVDQRYVQAILAQINQDFKRIQILRNELVRALSANDPLDYKRVSDMTSDIKKRAERLRLNLALPDSKIDEKKRKDHSELKGEQMKDALITLADLIVHFITNPVFETPGVIDVQLSAKANRDLKSIAELSGHIRKSIGKMNEK